MTALAPGPTALRHGLGPNRGQFALLVLVNAFVGSMVGMERSVLPLLAESEFGIASATATLSFLVAFGVVKSLTNLGAGILADRVGRRRLLVAGWVAALPVAPLILVAPSWGWVVAANVLLGMNQGLAWSMTVAMKVDLAGPARRGLALGINEAAGYLAVAAAALVSAALASAHGPRHAPFLMGLGIAVAGLLVSALFVRDTSGHVEVEAEAAGRPSGVRSSRWVFWRTTLHDRSLSAACQAGLVTNLNDAMAWGLLPVFLARRGLTIAEVGTVAAVYPAVWGVTQLATGALADATGRRRLVVGGMWLQAAGIVAFLLADGFGGWVGASVVMGLGTAFVYPNLLAVVGDVAAPAWRASAMGVYRFWRDFGFVVGALVAGAVADLFGMRAAIGTVAAVTAASGFVAAARLEETLPASRSGAVT